MEKKKRVLIVSLGHYPNWGTGSNLFRKILYDGHLLEKLDRVDVLTYKHSYEDRDEECIDGVYVYRLFLWRQIGKNDLLKAALTHPYGFFVGGFQRAYNHFAKKICGKRVFDAGVISDVYDALVNMKASEYDCIVTIVWPYEGAIAVSRYSHQTGVKFIVWQGDPCSTNYAMPPKSLNERIEVERDLFNTASMVLTAPWIYKDLLSQQTISFDKSNAIPMELPLIIPWTQSQLQQHKRVFGPIKCVFVGNIYGEIRDPEYTLRLFGALDSKLIQLHIYGRSDKKIESDKVICHGSIMLDEVFRVEDDADVLVNIGNSVLNQVPSKIFEYISTGKPIINICKNRNCPTLPYFEKYPLVLNLFEEENIFDKQLIMLKNFIMENCNKRVNLNEIKELYKECTPEYCAEIFLKGIDG